MNNFGKNISQSYAGLWVRIKAFSADYVVISIYIAFLVAVSLLIQSIDPKILQPLFGAPMSGQLSGFVLITLPVTLYFAISESSFYQATWGKRWQKIQVVDNHGKRLSLMRALGRTILKFIPWELAHTCIWQMTGTNEEFSLIILIGFILVWVLVGIYLLTLLLSSKKQTLYDRLANTVVIKRQKSAHEKESK